jgi:hypothetical protein
VPGNLALQFTRIGPVPTAGRQMKCSRINVEKLASLHASILAWWAKLRQINIADRQSNGLTDIFFLQIRIRFQDFVISLRIPSATMPTTVAAGIRKPRSKERLPFAEG